MRIKSSILSVVFYIQLHWQHTQSLDNNRNKVSPLDGVIRKADASWPILYCQLIPLQLNPPFLLNYL